MKIKKTMKKKLHHRTVVLADVEHCQFAVGQGVPEAAVYDVTLHGRRRALQPGAGGGLGVRLQPGEAGV